MSHIDPTVLQSITLSKPEHIHVSLNPADLCIRFKVDPSQMVELGQVLREVLREVLR